MPAKKDKTGNPQTSWQDDEAEFRKRVAKNDSQLEECTLISLQMRLMLVEMEYFHLEGDRMSFTRREHASFLIKRARLLLPSSKVAMDTVMDDLRWIVQNKKLLNFFEERDFFGETEKHLREMLLLHGDLIREIEKMEAKIRPSIE